VWRRSPANGASDEVHKIYVSGASTDAEYEASMGAVAAGSGVVPYLSAGTDPASKRPVVRQKFIRGENLEAMALRVGALPASQALRLIRAVAQTLARLHAIQAPSAPRGLCHGDVKPQNLISNDDGGVTLLDFEHARPIGVTTAARMFTGGTVAWSPPEAHSGATPDATFDVFGLGATLAFLLNGGTSRHIPQHSEVDALVLLCCSSEPDARPTAVAVATRCERLIASLEDDEAELHLNDWATGALDVRPTTCEGLRSSTWLRRHRLLQRLPDFLRQPDALPSTPSSLQAELDAVSRALERFPRNQAALTRRRDILGAIAELLSGAAETIQSHHKREDFAGAAQWLRTAETLVTSVAGVPAGLSAALAIADGAAPSALQRAPVEFLRVLATNNRADADQFADRKARIAEAQRELDMAQAEQLVEAMATEYGGTSLTVAEQRDDLHRLSFYLDRIARAALNVERVTPMWDPEELKPLRDLVTAAGAALAQRDNSGGGVGLRSLQLTLANVVDEFPHMTQVQPALDALAKALIHLTDKAWQQLTDAEQRLQVVPVPVRPLQLAVGRLDTARVLEAFVDRPDRPRSALIDGLERLRLGLEQARATRDRLTEDAEHSLARGHWTTGLFEMERAVAGLNPGDEGEREEAERLHERLQAARRTKQELESAVRRNAALNARYLTLEDDVNSTADARLQVLQERHDCLIFLGMHMPSERAGLYRKDLRHVETQIAVERAGDAERRLSALADPALRSRLANETLEALGANESGDSDSERSGRVLRLQEHWRAIAQQCKHAISAKLEEQRQNQRDHRRVVMVILLLILATTTAVGFALKPWLFDAPVIAKSK